MFPVGSRCKNVSYRGCSNGSSGGRASCTTSTSTSTSKDHRPSPQARAAVRAAALAAAAAERRRRRRRRRSRGGRDRTRRRTPLRRRRRPPRRSTRKRPASRAAAARMRHHRRRRLCRLHRWLPALYRRARTTKRTVRPGDVKRRATTTRSGRRLVSPLDRRRSLARCPAFEDGPCPAPPHSASAGRVVVTAAPRNRPRPSPVHLFSEPPRASPRR